MRHLGSDELIDLAEGTRPESSAPHLQICEPCRRQLADLRSVMAVAAEAEVPEPSPLFWNHFSARVHEAIADEGAPPRLGWFEDWSWSRRVAATIAVVAALVVASVVTVRLGRSLGTADPSPSGLPLVADGASLTEAAMRPDDPSLELVADLTEDMDWDAAREVGFAPRQGTAERAVSELTNVERRELQRLLKQELTRSSD